MEEINDHEAATGETAEEKKETDRYWACHT